jgi:hypothetical protein
MNLYLYDICIIRKLFERIYVLIYMYIGIIEQLVTAGGSAAHHRYIYIYIRIYVYVYL